MRGETRGRGEGARVGILEVELHTQNFFLCINNY